MGEGAARFCGRLVVFAVRKGHSTPWDMQFKHAGCRSSH